MADDTTKISTLPLSENLDDDDLLLVVEDGVSKKAEVGYLKEVFDGGSDVSITPSLGSGTKVADYEIDGVAGTIYVPTAPTALSQLSDDSTHRVVTDTEKNTWSGKQNALTFDNVPTQNSNNPVKSGGVYTAVKSVNDRLEDTEGIIEEAIGGYETITPTFTLTSPAYIDSDGSIKTNNTSMSMTNYVPVTSGDTVTYKRTTSDFYAWSGFFDEEHNIVGSTFTVDSTESSKITPENAKYVAFSGMTSRINGLIVTINAWQEGTLPEEIERKQDKNIGIEYAGKYLGIDNSGNIVPMNLNIEKKMSDKVPLYVSMMPDFFWVSSNEISAFSSSLPKYKEGTVSAENNAWFQISGNQGDDFVTIISGGNGDVSDITAAEKTKPFGCVIMYDDGRYYPCNAQYLSDTTFSVYPPLKENIVNGELAQIRTGIHLSRRGYRAYAQHLYNANPKHCEKSKYIEKWRAVAEATSYPWDNFGGTVIRQTAAYNISSNIVDKLQQVSYQIGYSASWGEQYFSDTPTGIEWETDISGMKGYVEFYLGLYGNSGSIYENNVNDAWHCELWIDGVKKSEIIKTSKKCERICFDYSDGNTAILKIYCNRWRVAGFGMYLNRVTWWINENKTDRDPLIPKGAVVGQLFDSWGEFDDAESAIYMQKEINNDAGVTIPYFNGSLSNMTSAWGRAWFYNKMWDNHPTVVLTDFGINDQISASGTSQLPSEIAGPDGKMYDNVISQEDYNNNMSAISSYAINNGIDIVFVGVGLPSYQTYPNNFIDYMANEV